MQLCRYSTLLKLPNKKVSSLYLDPILSISFDVSCSYLANTPIAPLSDPNKPYLLFTGTSKYCYSGILTQASMEKSNKALVQLLPDNDPLTSVKSQTQDLKLNANVVHPVAYISSQCRWPTITKECFSIFM